MAELASKSEEGEKKDSWPELLGLPAKEAVEKIKKESPLPIFVSPRSIYSADFSELIVRVSADSNGKVIEIPHYVEKKNSWPELLGLPVEEVVEKIKKENSLLKILVLPGSVDLRDANISVLVDWKGKVTEIREMWENNDLWPELLGLPAMEVMEKIKKENPLLSIFVSPQSIDISDLSEDVVSVSVDSNGKVIEIPRFVKKKGSWPEHLGFTAWEVLKKIKKENLPLKIFVPLGSIIASSFCEEKVWVWIDLEGKVIEIPQIVENKDSWPELLGLPTEEAVEKIKKENPLLKISVIKDSSIWTSAQAGFVFGWIRMARSFARLRLVSSCFLPSNGLIPNLLSVSFVTWVKH